MQSTVIATGKKPNTNSYNANSAFTSARSTESGTSRISHGLTGLTGFRSIPIYEKTSLSTFPGSINDTDNPDPRMRRMMSNRVSAQRARRRTRDYVVELEKKVRDLETHIAVLTPQVSGIKAQVSHLGMENKKLSQKFSDKTTQQLAKIVEIEGKKAEVNMYRQIYLDKLQAHNARHVSNNLLAAGDLAQQVTSNLSFINLSHRAQHFEPTPNFTQQVTPPNLSFVNQSHHEQPFEPIFNLHQDYQGQEWNNEADVLRADIWGQAGLSATQNYVPNPNILGDEEYHFDQ